MNSKNNMATNSTSLNFCQAQHLNLRNVKTPVSTDGRRSGSGMWLVHREDFNSGNVLSSAPSEYLSVNGFTYFFLVNDVRSRVRKLFFRGECMKSRSGNSFVRGERVKSRSETTSARREGFCFAGLRTLNVAMFVVLAMAMFVGGATMAVAQQATTNPQANETQGQGQTEIRVGHVDLGPRVTDSGIKLLVRDDTVVPALWRTPNDVLIRVNDSAKLVLPEDEAYRFLGVAPGEEVFVIPQTQNMDVVWLGWNTQDPQLTQHVQRGVTLALHAVEGPGAMHVFLQNGFDPPQPLLNSANHPGGEIWADVNTHTHANWVFTQPGAYLVTLAVKTTDINGVEQQDIATLRFAVGDQVESSQVFAMQPSQSSQSSVEGESSGASGSDGSNASTGSSGADGGTGSSGSDGAAGSSGSNGSTGSSGADGAAGSPGSDGAAENSSQNSSVFPTAIVIIAIAIVGLGAWGFLRSKANQQARNQARKQHG